MTFKQYLKEDFYKYFKVRGENVSVYKNPIKDEVKKEGEYNENFNRGLVDVKNGDLFVWNGGTNMMHDNFTMNLFTDYIPIYLYNNGSVKSMLYADEDEKFRNWVLKILNKNKNIEKYYNNKVKDIYISDFS